MVFPRAGNPEVGVDFINWLFNPAIAETLCFGWEGEHWYWDENGDRQFTDAIDDITFRWLYHDGLGFRQESTKEMENMEYGTWRIPLEQWAGGITSADLLLPPPQNVELERTNFMDHYEIEIVKFLMGERPISEYDDFINEMYDLGLRVILEEMQKIYNAS